MATKFNRSLTQILILWSMAVVIGASLVVLYLAGSRLKTVEENLKKTVVDDYASSDIVLEQMAGVVSAAETATADASPQNIETLKNRLRITQLTIKPQQPIQETADPIPTSVIHAIIAPALIEVQDWLEEGVHGNRPNSRATAQAVFTKVSTAFEKANFLNRQAYLQVEKDMEQDREQLNRYINSVRLLFLLTFAFTIITITLFIRQQKAKTRENKALAAIRKQGELLDSLVENIPLGIVVRNKDDSLAFINRRFTEITGYTWENMEDSDHWFEHAFPDPVFRQSVREDYESSKNRGEAYRQFKVTCKNGEEKEIEFITSFLPDGKSLITLSDITDRKKDEKRLHYFKTAVEHSADAIGMADPNGRHWFQNRSFNELFGDISEDPPASLYVDEAVGREVFKTIMGGGQWTGEVDMFDRDGRILNILLRAYAIKDEQNRIVGLVGTHTDMTRQKEAEKALARSEQQHRAVVENTPDLIYRTDLNGIITFITASVEPLSGYTVEEAIGLKMAEEVYAIPEERESFLEELRKKGFVRNFQARLKRKDGSYWWAATNAHFYTDEEGKVMGVEGITRDITEIKETEAALIESEQRMRAILEASPNPMVMYNKVGHPLFVNPAFTKVFGWALDELKGQQIPFVPEDQKDLTIKMIRDAYAEGTPQKFETKRLTKDGRFLDILISSSTTKGADEEPAGLVVNLTDITERKALEAQSEQAQKMESLGTLAGGIAHDFNNLLSGIFGYVDLARKKVNDPRIQDYLTKAFNSSDRARGLTHQLLTFSKGGTPVKKVDKLVPFLQETVQFALSGSNVTSSFEFPDDLWMCDYDKNQIGQVIDNIVINAHHAMPSGGNIQVSAKNLILKENEQVGLSPGNYVKISIADAGIGIPDKYLSRIFDPFFTTKQKGSGLGLATGYSIVKKHFGIITVDSRVGFGSTFHVFLPAAKIQVAASIEQDNTALTGSGRILIMDDEEMIHLMLGEMLEDMGFHYTIAENGEQAMEEFKKAREDNSAFDAVILDLTIRGGMGGKETVKEMRKIDDSIPIFVSSGYSEDDAIANPGDFGFTDSLKKPFGIEQLAGILKKYL